MLNFNNYTYPPKEEFHFIGVNLKILNGQNYFKSQHFVLWDACGSCNLVMSCVIIFTLKTVYIQEISCYMCDYFSNHYFQSELFLFFCFFSGIQEHGFQFSNDWRDLMIKKHPYFPLDFLLVLMLHHHFLIYPGLKCQHRGLFSLRAFVQGVISS